MTEPLKRPFADHVADYAQAGWPCILPVPPRDKFPPPVGFTGAEGRDTDPLQLVAWAGSHAGWSIALRMPEHVIGIDVDQYVKKGLQKRGAETLASCIERWGSLPATWTSTAREPDGPSRVHFFRVPPRRYATRLTGTVPDGAGGTVTVGDVEILQRHHRYAVVWPSPHHTDDDAPATTYRWYDPQGHPVDAPPKPDELAELPPAWLEGLTAGATDQGPASADPASGSVLLEQLLADTRPECADLTSARLRALDEMGRSDAGSRHDTMTERVHHLTQLAAGGHPGVGLAAAELRDLWAHLTAGEDRAEEFERAWHTSARKAVSVVGPHQVPQDPCLFGAGAGIFPVPAPAPADESGDGPGDAPEPVAPPRWFSVREFIGAQAFDPNAGLDQTLAEKVLERTWPALRYAYDARSWLLRVPERWEVHKDLGSWAIAQVAPLMPVGDPTADKGSEPHERSARRARLMTAGGAGAVAKKMSSLVAGGTHPAALKLGDLDSDPEVLWAGGLPWSLRESREAPVVAAGVDPATPHLHAAAIAPAPAGDSPGQCPTPLWDAFLEAVWPDPELRAWAMRVLAIAVTGYSDRALPILLGETGRGKTQLIDLTMSVLGSYAHAANPKLLGVSQMEHDTIVYALKGRRLSFIDEAPSEARAGQERLKQLTGGGELTARQMNQDPVTFRPTHTLVLTANDPPLLTDPAVRARTRLIPCEGDPELVWATRAAIGHVSGRAWRREAPGVLGRLITEAAAWLAEPGSAAVTAAPEHIRYLAERLGAEQDPVTVWLEEETEPDEDGTPSRELYQAFTASCMRNNLRRDQIPSETKWGRTLTQLGYPSRHTEYGKRRPLKLRTGGGFLPGMPPAPTATADQLMTGPARLQENRSSEKPQVNPNESVNPDGLTGTHTSLSRVRAPAHTHEGEPGNTPNRAGDPLANDGQTALDLGKDLDDPVSPTDQSNRSALRPDPKPRKKATKSAEATQRAADKRAEARQQAIAAAAGETFELPAVLLRDGRVLALSVPDADALLATITGPGAPGELTVDVETTGYPIGHADFGVRTAQLGDENLAVVLDPSDPHQAEIISTHLAAATVLHAHSATADLIPLAHIGLLDLESAWDRMVDTAILAKLSDPASTGNDADLKGLSRSVLGRAALSPDADKTRAALFKAGKWLTDTEVTTPLERSGWAQVDPRCETQLRYAGSDVLDDAALAKLLPQPPPEVLERERTVQRMTARMAHTGFRFDAEQIDRLVTEHRTARVQHAEHVQAFGVENPGSTQQVGAAFGQLGVLLPATPTGKPSVAGAVLERLKNRDDPGGALASAVLDWRHHDTALKLLLEPWHELVTRGDGRARSTIYTLGADTGRMSSVRFNFQQVSREGGLRGCITADPGHLLASADFAGVELRVAAALSGDRSLIAILEDPERDLHWEVARIAFGTDATKANRYAVKRGVFGRIYGGGVEAVANGVGVDLVRAQAVIDAMDALTPQLSEWSRMVREGIKAGRTKFPTASGRTIHLPVGAPHAGPNYCIQGTARELLVDALLRWRQTRWGAATLLPVHDELVVMVPEDEAEAATAALTDVMTTELAGVPIIAEASMPSYAWSDAS